MVLNKKIVDEDNLEMLWKLIKITAACDGQKKNSFSESNKKGCKCPKEICCSHRGHVIAPP